MFQAHVLLYASPPDAHMDALLSGRPLGATAAGRRKVSAYMGLTRDKGAPSWRAQVRTRE